MVLCSGYKDFYFILHHPLPRWLIVDPNFAVCREHQFKDHYLFYRFHADDEGYGTVPTAGDRKEAEEELPDVLSMLAQNAPDAMMRMILRKP